MELIYAHVEIACPRMVFQRERLSACVNSNVRAKRETVRPKKEE
jgi:hypothetical protein